MDENGNIDEMIEIITRKTVPVKKDTLQGNRGGSPGRASREGSSMRPPRKNNQKVRKFRAGDQMYFPEPENQQERKLREVAESIGGFASQSDIGGSRKAGNDSAAHAGKHEMGTWGPSIGASGKAPQPIATTDFYAGSVGLNGSQSALSQDVHIQDAMAPRPGGKGKKGTASQHDRRQLERVYGHANERSARGSPSRPQSKSRDNQGARLFSADPRLRGLESIYLTKFNHQSQKNMK